MSSIITGRGKVSDQGAARRHRMWGSVANAWSDYADYADERGARITEWMLTATRLRKGQRVLELACGAGGTGLAAAELVGPDGEVVLSDVAPEMAAIAASRAKRRARRNVRTRVLDLDHLDEPDESYDAVLCREGLMFAGDPVGAAAEIRRVLRPGGRVAVAVWGPPERNPWLSLVLRSVADHVGHPVPPPGVPGPFSLADEAVLGRALAGAGLADIEIAGLDTPARADSFDTWWARTCALAGPLSTVIAALPAESVARLRGRVRAAVEPFVTPAGLELPGLALLATARRP